MIRVVNKKTFKGRGVYIGRPSIFGNPFTMSKESDRVDCIQKYKGWFWTQYHTDQKFYIAVHELAEQARKGELILICWCAPKPCHGDIIKDFIQYLNEMGKEPNWF